MVKLQLGVESASPGKSVTWTHIFIVHENPAQRSAAATVLNTHKHFRVIYAMGSADECLVRLGAANCDLILASVNSPNNDVRKLLKYVRQQIGSIKVIVTDLANDPQQILSYIAAGAAGYVLADEGVATWAQQVDAVHCGQPLVSPAMAVAMMKHLAILSQLTVSSNTLHDQRHTNLTRREYEVLLLLGEGFSNQTIATQLIITVGTVKNHVHHVLKKLNLSRRKIAKDYLSQVS